MPLRPTTQVVRATMMMALLALTTESLTSKDPRRNSPQLPSFVMVKESTTPIPVQQAYLHPQTSSSPQSTQVFALTCSGITDLPPTANFLATQVWPSARVAAMAMEAYLQSGRQSTSVVCEFGCGPGLPSLTAARAGAAKVFATDLDETALALVQEASRRQDLSHLVEPLRFDLVNSYMEEIPHADLYLFSDVFENAQVAEGSARVTAELLMRGRSQVWVFAQSDRSQRDVFLTCLRELLGETTLAWSTLDHSTPERADDKSFWAPLQYYDSLWLHEIDESTVKYC